ncbi:MAG: MBL fold metallo-hydrolase [Phycisphaera sp.]|nr:MBL fold metallo-hydrolase [Phycisphaera sp.]
MRLFFLGANRQVTGSRYWLETATTRIMIDHGMFQEREFLWRNWQECPITPDKVDVLLLTHAHFDHVGRLPKYVKEGFKGPVICTEPTVDLARIVLEDSARIQEEDAEYKRRRHEEEGRRGPYEEEALYDMNDVERTMKLMRGVEYGSPVEIGEGVTATFHEAGHILGSAALEINVHEDGRDTRIIFSGDLGQWDKPIIDDPELLTSADYVVMESTYGDREHSEFADIEGQLERVINETFERRGNVVIPTFAIERAQELMYHLGNLHNEKRIPNIPVFLDSPMAVSVTETFRRFRRYYDAEAWERLRNGHSPLEFPELRFTRSVADSKAINTFGKPCVILASSGMCTGGRIKHHLKANITRPESTIVFVGYQSRGTLGRQILGKPKEVRIHGRYWPVRAHIETIAGMSAHGDREDLMRWLSAMKPCPKHVFLTHGEEEASLSLSEHVSATLNCEVSVPHYRDSVILK